MDVQSQALIYTEAACIFCPVVFTLFVCQEFVFSLSESKVERMNGFMCWKQNRSLLYAVANISETTLAPQLGHNNYSYYNLVCLCV